MTTTTRPKSRYTLTEPCGNCPFRCDQPTYLREERAREIAASLRGGSDFTCHKTVDYVEDDNGDIEPQVNGRGRACAGALITMEKEGLSTQGMRIAERLGLYDRDRLNYDSPTYDDLTSWVRAHSESPVPTVTTDAGEVLEYEHCGVVGPDCEDPAGYGAGGGAWENDETPTCNPLTDSCQHCGAVCCPACISRTETITIGGKSFEVVTCSGCDDDAENEEW